MKNKKYLIISIIAFVLGGMSCGIVILFTFFGSLLCGEPFYMISGSDGPIPSCTSIINTDFIWPLAIGFVLLLTGILFYFIWKKS